MPTNYIKKYNDLLEINHLIEAEKKKIVTGYF